MIPTMLLNMANWMSLIMLDQVLRPQSEIGTLVNYITKFGEMVYATSDWAEHASNVWTLIHKNLKSSRKPTHSTKFWCHQFNIINPNFHLIFILNQNSKQILQIHVTILLIFIMLVNTGPLTTAELICSAAVCAKPNVYM